MWQWSRNNYYSMNKKGFTLLELLVALGIFLLLIVPISAILINGFKYNSVIWDQLEAQNDGRRAIREVADVLRKAENSSLGGFPIVSAGNNDLTVYANVDNDSYREKVRFWLDGTILKKNIIKPSGNPLSYSGTGTTTELSHYVVNIAKNFPLFSYYDTNYTGVESSLSVPLSVTAIRVIKIDLELEKNPDKTPVPLRVENMVQVRNLKSN